jgi:hypothetical protein
MSAPDLESAFRKVFNNGTGQVGLEVGNDPGLPVSDWIQVPKSMIKRIAFRVATEGLADWAAHAAEFNPGAPTTGTRVDDFDSAEAAAARYGWVYNQAATVLVANGKKWAKVGTHKVLIDKAVQRNPTSTDAMNFYTANIAAVRPNVLLPEERKMAHAVRFWTVVAGLVAGTKSREYVEVDDPPQHVDGSKEFAEYAVNFMAQSFTAAAARAGNWRKSNHATGGPIATGFAATWLRKEGFTAAGSDAREMEAVQKRITDAFYVATHAASVHSVLALMAPGDPGHWAEIVPKFGIYLHWDVMDSARIRLEGMTQIAGGAMVADAIVAVKMLIREGLGPLLNHRGQLGVLALQHATLESAGVAGGVYAKWYMDGHPEGRVAEPFSQKGQGADDLIGEIAWAATKYYASHTIGKSPALASAASQLGDPAAEAAWGSLAKSKTTMSAAQIVAAYNVVKKAAAVGDISKLTDKNADVVKSAVLDYNRTTNEMANQVSVVGAVTVDQARVLEALAATVVPTTDPNADATGPQGA